MAIKTILASLTGFSSDRSVLDAAVAAARSSAAHIQCLHVRIDVSQTADFIDASARKGDVLFELSRKIGEEAASRSRHAQTAFQDARKRHALPVADRPEQAMGISIAWKEVVTLEDEALAQARYHDVTVMGRDRELSREAIQAVLMRSGRPLLLAPAEPIATLGHHVVIGWKDTPEAARAVTAAMPLLGLAKTVTIACVSASKAASGRQLESAELLSRQLAWHGIKADIHEKDRGPLSEPETLRAICYGRGADLLVMGAYGHSRTRELVFGGMTEGLLADCALPVFMLH